MIGFFFALQFFLKGIAKADVYACRTYHLNTKTTHTAKIGWIALWSNNNDAITMGARKCVGFLSNATRIKAIEIATRSEHHETLLLLEVKRSSTGAGISRRTSTKLESIG